MEFLNSKYEEASKKLKNQLPCCGIEILNLKKQIASLTGN
jgi:centromeric protein E